MMETVLLIIGIVALALVLLRPAPQPTIVYVPIEVAERRGGLGCLPLLVVALLALLALGGRLIHEGHEGGRGGRARYIVPLRLDGADRRGAMWLAVVQRRVLAIDVAALRCGAIWRGWRLRAPIADSR